MAEPSVRQDESGERILLYDGDCGFCGGFAEFVRRRDNQARFAFAPLQSEAGRRLLQEHGLPIDFLASAVLIDRGGAHIRSDGVLRSLEVLSWPWRSAGFFRLLPRRWRDRMYDAVARNRHSMPTGARTCPAPTSPGRALPERTHADRASRGGADDV